MSAKILTLKTRSLILGFFVMLFCVGCSFPNNRSKITNYYINSLTGCDNNSGLSPTQAWKSLQSIETHSFSPGDSLLFAANSKYEGGVLFNSSGTYDKPIVISKYGPGALPKFSNKTQNHLNGNAFQINGSNVIIDGLHFEECANDSTQQDKKILSLGAVFANIGADSLIIKNCKFNDCPIGINILSQHCTITNNEFSNCNRFLSEPDWGPLGIVIANAYNEICYNTCLNYVKIGGNWGADGGFIELDDRYFGTKVHDIKIHHNKSIDNMGFVEVETQVEGHNIDIYYNLSNDYQEFVFFWGGDSSKIENNTVIRTKPSLNGAVNTVFTMRNDNFTLRNNIFVVANGIQVLKTAPYGVGNYANVIHEHNLYWSFDSSVNNPCGLTLNKGEIIADPGFIDFEKSNFNLSKKSIARNNGMYLGYKTNFSGEAIDEDNTPNIGAY